MDRAQAHSPYLIFHLAPTPNSRISPFTKHYRPPTNLHLAAFAFDFPSTRRNKVQVSQKTDIRKNREDGCPGGEFRKRDPDYLPSIPLPAKCAAPFRPSLANHCTIFCPSKIFSWLRHPTVHRPTYNANDKESSIPLLPLSVYPYHCLPYHHTISSPSIATRSPTAEY